MADETDSKKPPRTAAEIETDLAAIRSRLSANVASLIDEVHPQRITQRQIEGAKQWASSEAEDLKLQFVTAEGGLRTARVVAIGAAVVGAVGFIVLIKALGSRRS